MMCIFDKINIKNMNIVISNMKAGNKYDVNDLKIEGLNKTEMKEILLTLVKQKELKVIIDENNIKKYIIYTDALKNKDEKERIKKNKVRYKGGYIKRIEYDYKSEYVCSFYYKNNLVLKYMKAKRFIQNRLSRCTTYYTKAGVAILDKKKVKELSKNVIDRIVYFKKKYWNGVFICDVNPWWGMDVKFDKDSFHSTGPQYLNKNSEYPKYAYELMDYLYKFIEENGEVVSGKDCQEKIRNLFPELKNRL